MNEKMGEVAMRRRMLGMVNPANLVTFGRIAAILVLPFLLKVQYPVGAIVALILCPILFLMDSLDGILARKYRCETAFGSVLDVTGDRIAENVLWILLYAVGVIPIAIPLIVIVRGFITDSFRSYALSKGKTTYGLMESRLGRWMVASPASRSGYAVLKAIVFTLGLGIYAFRPAAPSWLIRVELVAAWAAVAFCLVRGFFTVREALPLFASEAEKVAWGRTWEST